MDSNISVKDEEQTDKKVRDQSRKKAKIAFAEITKPVKGLIQLSKLLALLSALLSFVPFMVLVTLGGILLDNRNVDSGQIYTLTTILIVSFILRLGLYFGGLSVSHWADLKLNVSVQDRLIDTISKAPLSFFSETTSGAVRRAIQDDLATMHMVVAHKPVDFVVSGITPLVLLAYMFYVDWRVALLSLATLPFYFIVYAIMYATMGDKTAQLDDHLNKISSAMVEYVSGIAVVKAFGQVGKAHKRFADASTDMADFYWDWAKPFTKTTAITMSIVAAPTIVAVMAAGGYFLVRDGHVNVAELIAATVVAISIPLSINAVMTYAWMYQLSEAAALRVYDNFNIAPLGNIPSQGAVRDTGVEYKDASLDFEDVQALKNINIKLEAGTVNAIVGPSGSGKSSLAHLLARFYDPVDGKVSIGDVNIASFEDNDLYDTVSFVLQDSQIVRASIRDNIALGMNDVTQEQIEDAARIAHIHDEILEIDKGYDAIVGEDTNLSGGQAQRIAIARAVLKDSDVLILDEATAMADPESEADIQKGLSALAKDKTVLVIAHKASSIRGVDNVLVLNNGELEAHGTPDELADNTIFSNMK